MYASPYSGDATGFVNGFAMTGKGVGATSPLGAVAPGSSFSATGGGGGLYASIDVTPNFRLTGQLAYRHTSVDAGSGGSAQLDDYVLSGYADYHVDNSYVRSLLSYDFGRTALTIGATGGNGKYNTNAVDADVKAGHLFTLVDPGVGVPGAIPTKAVPQTSGYGLFLDVSAHTGLYSSVGDSFTDSTGFAWGNGYLHFGDVGAAASLDWQFYRFGMTWLPYAEVNVNQLFAYNDDQDIPAQAGAAANVVSFSRATTFAGAKLGVQVVTRPGYSVKAEGFYNGSADISIFGGDASFNVLF